MVDQLTTHSVVLPVWNEAVRLKESIISIAEYFGKMNDSWELVAVDDGSTDASLHVLRSLEADGVPIKIAVHDRNSGKGSAVRTGMLMAKGKFRLITDVDLAVPIETYDHFRNELESGSDVVIGSRRMPGASIVRSQPWLREKLGGVFRLICRLIFVPDISDFTCGFKAFRAEAVDDIFPLQKIDRWGYDTEILVIAREHRLKITQIPIAWTDSGESRVRLLKDIARSSADLARIAWYRACGKYTYTPGPERTHS